MNFDEGTPGRGLQGLMDEEMVVIIEMLARWSTYFKTSTKILSNAEHERI